MVFEVSMDSQVERYLVNQEALFKHKTTKSDNQFPALLLFSGTFRLTGSRTEPRSWGSADSDGFFSSRRAAAGGGQQAGAAREPGAGAQPADAVPGVPSRRRECPGRGRGLRSPAPLFRFSPQQSRKYSEPLSRGHQCLYASTSSCGLLQLCPPRRGTEVPRRWSRGGQRGGVGRQ